MLIIRIFGFASHTLCVEWIFATAITAIGVEVVRGSGGLVNSFLMVLTELYSDCPDVVHSMSAVTEIVIVNS